MPRVGPHSATAGGPHSLGGGRRAKGRIVNSVTRLLEAHRAGEPAAFGRLVELVYQDLRRIARGPRATPAKKKKMDAKGAPPNAPPIQKTGKHLNDQTAKNLH